MKNNVCPKYQKQCWEKHRSSVKERNLRSAAGIYKPVKSKKWCKKLRELLEQSVGRTMGGSNGNKKWEKKIERIARGELDDIVPKKTKTPFTM